MASLTSVIIALAAFAGLTSASPISITNTTIPCLYEPKLAAREHFPPSKVLNETGIDCFGRWHQGYQSVFHISILNVPDRDIRDLCGGLWDNLHAYDDYGCTVDDRLHYCGHRHSRNSGLKWVFQTNSDCPRPRLIRAFKLATNGTYGDLQCRPNWDFKWEAKNGFAEDLLNAPPDGPPFEDQLNMPGGDQIEWFGNERIGATDNEDPAGRIDDPGDPPTIAYPAVNMTNMTGATTNNTIVEIAEEHESAEAKQEGQSAASSEDQPAIIYPVINMTYPVDTPTSTTPAAAEV